MVVFLNQNISVAAVFKGGDVFPRWFLYRGRKVAVQEVTYTWKEQKGKALLHHFAVSDGTNVYDIAFQPVALSWSIEAVEEE
ncbi:MAG: hypothetical protein NTX06_06860 [Proteobacteria bacterium]|nr:hypothetical protein [Pseudomonadota bacterium]